MDNSLVWRKTPQRDEKMTRASLLSDHSIHCSSKAMWKMLFHVRPTKSSWLPVRSGWTSRGNTTAVPNFFIRWKRTALKVQIIQSKRSKEDVWLLSGHHLHTFASGRTGCRNAAKYLRSSSWVFHRFLHFHKSKKKDFYKFKDIFFPSH